MACVISIAKRCITSHCLCNNADRHWALSQHWICLRCRIPNFFTGPFAANKPPRYRKFAYGWCLTTWNILTASIIAVASYQQSLNPYCSDGRLSVIPKNLENETESLKRHQSPSLYTRHLCSVSPKLCFLLSSCCIAMTVFCPYPAFGPLFCISTQCRHSLIPFHGAEQLSLFLFWWQQHSKGASLLVPRRSSSCICYSLYCLLKQPIAHSLGFMGLILALFSSYYKVL